MRKYLLKILLFFALVAAVDFVFGRVCGYLASHPQGGLTANLRYICEASHEDILMLGSSRMQHHYVPGILRDSLGMSCYNAGIGGNGIILSYGLMEMVLERYSPRIVLYDVSSFDMYADDNSRYIDNLKPFCLDHPELMEILTDVNPAEKWKIRSGLYRYNSQFLALLGDYLRPSQSLDNGYWPLQGVMDYEPELPHGPLTDVDPLKMNYLSKFIDLCRSHGVTLFFIASPSYFGALLPADNDPAKHLCEASGVPFLDYYADSLLCSSKAYWADAVHLNDAGAQVFTRKIAGVLKTCTGF
jgi:hypothetical protein